MFTTLKEKLLALKAFLGIIIVGFRLWDLFRDDFNDWL